MVSLVEDEEGAWPSDAVHSRATLLGMLKNLRDEFTHDSPENIGSPLSRPDRMIDRILWNRAHCHGLPVAGPVLAKPFDEAYRYQSGIPLNVHQQLRARLLENPVRIDVTPSKPTATQQKNADDVAHVLGTGLEAMAEREGIDIVGCIADGQIIEAYGVLHWGRGEVAQVPEFDDAYGIADDLIAQYRDAVVEHGFPYWVEAPHPSTLMWRRDRRSSGPANGLAVVAHVRVVSFFDAQTAIMEQRGEKISWNELDNTVSIYDPAEAPIGDNRDQTDGGKKMTLCTIWTRDECYELISAAEGGAIADGMNWRLIDYFKHDWGMPPYVLIPAIETNDPDPVIRYQPVLEGVYRAKPYADRMISLMLILSEQIATPMYYLEATKDGAMLRTDNGEPMYLTRDSLAATPVPDGYTLKAVPFELNPAFVDAVRFAIEGLEEARPPTGSAEFTASTQPWTARLQQSQASVVPKLLGRNASAGIKVMMRSIARDIARNKIPVAVYAKGRKGGIDKSKSIMITPEQVQTLDVDVSINNVSSVERITLMEHMRTLLNDPKVGLTLREFVEEAEGREDVDGVVAERMADKLFNEYVLPQRAKQLAAEKYGRSVVIGPNGDFFGMGGQPMAPEQVLAMNGVTMPPPAPRGMGGGGGAGQMRNQVVMPGMPALQEPNSLALPGVR